MDKSSRNSGTLFDLKFLSFVHFYFFQFLSANNKIFLSQDYSFIWKVCFLSNIISSLFTLFVYLCLKSLPCNLSIYLYIYLIIYLSISERKKERMKDFLSFYLSIYLFQSCYYVQTNIRGKGMNPLILPAMGWNVPQLS